LPHLLQFTSQHRKEGKSLQASVEELEDELKQALDEIWKPMEEDVQAGGPAVPIIMELKPEVTVCDWRVRLFDMNQ